MDIKLLRNLAAMDALNDTGIKTNSNPRWTNADEAVEKVLTMIDEWLTNGSDFIPIESVYDAIVSAYVLPEEESDDE